ncbi:MAG: NAD(P)-binding domain-containing protein [Oscillospiraceae bacterium]|jgi:dipicolinate synthase subunit A|nr:NAD(P)-binding domain-containing protein [Oscillospiraceae bacterium]
MPEHKGTVAVLGGDTRQIYAARALRAAGFSVVTCGLPEAPALPADIKHAASLREAMEGSRVLLCPVPFTSDGAQLLHPPGIPLPISVFLEGLRHGQIVIAGSLPENAGKRCRALGVPAFALLNRADFARLNAIPTAEAAIALAVMQGAGNLHGSRCLVLGFGHCGKALAERLASLGAKPCVLARREESIRLAHTAGFAAADFDALPQYLPQCDYVFNTVPTPVLPGALLALLPGDAVVIDIAAAPGGTDFAAAQALGLQAGRYPGLPGKYAPRAAGEALAAITQKILDELEGAA